MTTDSNNMDAEEQFYAQVDETIQSWLACGNSVNKAPPCIKREFLIENLVDKSSLNVIYGPPKSCKTLIAQSMAHHLSTSAFWCNHRIINRCNVLYLGYEDPESLKLRQAALAQSECKELDEDIGYVSLVGHNIPRLATDFAFTTIREYFTYLIDSGPEIYMGAVLFIDTLNMAFSHLGNENDAQFMAEVAKFSRRLCEIGITVFIIHHSGKDVSKGLRGHTALAGAVDNIFLCKKKNKDTVELTQEMWRNGPSGKKIIFAIQETNVEIIASRELRSMSCPIAVFGAAEMSPSVPLNPSEMKFLKAMHETKIENPEFFINEFHLPDGISPSQLTDVIDKAVENKIAPNATSRKNAARTAIRAKTKLLERGLIEENNGLVWKLPSGDKN